MRPRQRVSKQERDEHERTHLPYRDWCDICEVSTADVVSFQTSERPILGNGGDSGLGRPDASTL